MNWKRAVPAAMVAVICALGMVPASADPPSNTIVGTVNRDLLVGTRGRDVIFGLERRDTLYGGGQADELFSGQGSDRIYAVDGRADLVIGGRPGRARTNHLGLRGDRCIVDARDTVYGCETLIVRPFHHGDGDGDGDHDGDHHHGDGDHDGDDD